VARAFLLALLAALNPTLLGATTIMLVLTNPARLMLGYLLGAVTTSVTLGLLIVFSLEDVSTVSTTQHTISPGVDIALGLVAILAARLLARRAERRSSPPVPSKPKSPPRWQAYLSHSSSRGAFLIGALLTLPGASYLAGLRQIDRGGYSTPVTVLAILGFNVVMLSLLELPLLGFLIAPDWTQRKVAAARALISRRGRQLGIAGLHLIGAALVLKGLVGLIAG
jgi:hypothetical protein